MTKRPSRRLRPALIKGFSLIELIVVIVALSIGAVVLISMQGQVVRGQADTGDIQTGAQLLQECAERILLTRRRGAGYAAIVTSANCYGLTAFGGFSAPSVVISTPGTPPCPTGATCKLAVISATRDTSTITSVRVMVVDY